MSSLARSEHDRDPRIVRGMAKQLDARRRRLAAGERSLGWKVGFGTPTAMEALGIGGPLTGFLTDAGALESGEAVSLRGWAKPMLEPEVAVHLGEDVPAGCTKDAAWRAVSGLGPAFELADVHPPPTDAEAILAGNVFQRAVVVGAASDPPPPGDLAATIAGPGGTERVVAHPEEATGPLVDVVRHVADRVGAFGETLRGGELVICGSIVSPIEVAPGDAYEYRLGDLGELSVRFRA